MKTNFSAMLQYQNMDPLTWHLPHRLFLMLTTYSDFCTPNISRDPVSTHSHSRWFSNSFSRIFSKAVLSSTFPNTAYFFVCTHITLNAMGSKLGFSEYSQ